MWKIMFVFVTITLARSTTTKLVENGVFPCRFDSGAPKYDEFKCQNGSSCVHMEQVCDGIAQCPDASDEVYCVHSQKRSRRSNSCTLPPYPNRGTYKVFGNRNPLPGQSFDSFVLTVSCRRGYGVDGNNTVFCVNGVWHQNMPQCVRFCKLDPDPSVRYMCHLPGVGLKICDNYVPPGTLVSPMCNTPIYYSSETLTKMKCTVGFWNYVAQCKAECGRVSPDGTQLVIDGKNAKRGELPWHVGVYRKTSDIFEQICGGSLISNNVVLSAAHCFWSDIRKLLPASIFATAIGKLYRSWDNKRDFSVQKSAIKQIKIPTLFEGAAANFQEDIAILILTTPFVYHTYVRPVCLNFNINFERLQLQQGNSGKVAGWGLTAANGDASPILQVVDMPFINENTCIKTLPPSFREFITGDKFCAGYTNGTAVCKGDSGGGLAFADRELGIDRYYLRGIVSAAPRNDDKVCNDNAYTTFTKITKHQELINDALAESASRTCPFYSFQCVDGSCVDQGADCDGIRDCEDGSDESEELCSPVADEDDLSQTSGNCVLPPYPDHGTYVVANTSDVRPGQRKENFDLTVVCSEGYVLVSLAIYYSITKRNKVSCHNGVWDRALPKCVPNTCEFEGVQGKCLRPLSCPAPLEDSTRISKSSLCTSPSDITPLICCTNPEIVTDRKLFLVYPITRIVNRRGTSKAKNKCIEYMNTLDYPCTRENSPRNAINELLPGEMCYPKHREQPNGELSTATRDVSRGEFPHMALLGLGDTIDKTKWLCGGTIISEKFILTTAHCANNVLGPVKYVGLGILKHSDPVELSQRYNVKSIIVARPSEEYSITLVETDRQIAFSRSVLPACLYMDDGRATYEYLPGWGALIEPLPKDDSLHSVLKIKFKGRYLNGNEPQNQRQKEDNYSSIQMCNKDAKCKGDNDGLSQSPDENCVRHVFVITGILSYPVDCEPRFQRSSPTLMEYYTEWIEKIVWP